MAELLEVCEVARLLGVTPTRVRQLSDEKRLRPFSTTARGQRLFRLRDVDRFIRQRAERTERRRDSMEQRT